MATSKDYFAQVAGEWDELRSGFFTETMRDAAISKAQLPPAPIVADVGTGTGFVLQGLLDQAAELVGFDESAEMLQVAAERFASADNVELRLAEGHNLAAGDQSFDAVFANMYLHHAPDPGATIAEMARILKPGGKLVITDLDPHTQEWMQEEMADLWLGFDREQIHDWYQSAGLTHIDIDCAEGSCDCSSPQAEDVSLGIFVAIGEKS